MTKRETMIFNNSVEQHFESLNVRQQEGDVELANMSSEDLWFEATELAQAGYDDAMDSRMEDQKKRRSNEYRNRRT